MTMRPVVGMQAEPVEHQIIPGPRQHPMGRVVVAHPVESHQGHRAAFNGVARGCHCNLFDILTAATIVLNWVVDNGIAQLGREYVDIVQQVQVSPGPHHRIVGLDEALGCELGLGKLQRPAPAGFKLGFDTLALFVFVDQFVAIRQPRHELARIQVYDIDLIERGAVRRFPDAEALQENH